MKEGRSLEEILEGIGIDKLAKTPQGYKGCCNINPNHIDEKPSMYIHPEKGIVKCFSCGAFKSLFNYLLDNGATFDEAIGYMFSKFEHDKSSTDELEEWVLGRKIPKSFIDRGFEINTLKNFGVGYDEVSMCTTIPLRYKSKLYGIKYRKYPKQFWYSEAFKKDNFIYNYEASDIRIISEGETDTWKIWQNGSENVSALLTAYPSEGQLELLSKHKELWLALDNDKAGFRGAFKIHRTLSKQLTIKIIPFRGKDAGEQTKQGWKEALSRLTSFTEFEVMMIKKNPSMYQDIINSI